MWDMLYYLGVVLFLAVGMITAAVLIRANAAGPNLNPFASFFAPKLDRRIDVVEFANVDGRRKLILIRRDDVEHLIMTGGPVDVVIETGIHEPRSGHRAPPPTDAHPASMTSTRFLRP